MPSTCYLPDLVVFPLLEVLKIRKHFVLLAEFCFRPGLDDAYSQHPLSTVCVAWLSLTPWRCSIEYFSALSRKSEIMEASRMRSKSANCSGVPDQTGGKLESSAVAKWKI